MKVNEPILFASENNSRVLLDCVQVNKFDEDSAADFANKMAMAHNTGQGVIPIVIDSYGGQVYSLMSMISNIKAAELPIATIIEGKAMSCGAILFSFGTQGYRFMDPDATVMIGKDSCHEVDPTCTQVLLAVFLQILFETCVVLIA